MKIFQTNLQHKRSMFSQYLDAIDQSYVADFD